MVLLSRTSVWEFCFITAILCEHRDALLARDATAMLVVIFAGVVPPYPANDVSKVFHRELLVLVP